MMPIAQPLGVGLGLRPEFQAQLESVRDRLDFLEVITDSCFDPRTAEGVLALRKLFPVVCHGINMSLGSAEPLDDSYLARSYSVFESVRPSWFSEHLAMTHIQGIDIGHLAPVSFCEQTVSTIVDKVRTVQARAGLPMLLENVTYYFRLPTLASRELTEPELLTRILLAADCGLLLDLNNLLANARNHRYDPYDFLAQIPLERVVQVHIAGGAWRDGVYIDTHANSVEAEVWRLLEHLCRRAPVKAILLERDFALPPLADLLAELECARSILLGSRS